MLWGVKKLRLLLRFARGGGPGSSTFFFCSPKNKFGAGLGGGPFWETSGGLWFPGCANQVYGNQDVIKKFPFKILSGKDL